MSFLQSKGSDFFGVFICVAGIVLHLMNSIIFFSLDHYYWMIKFALSIFSSYGLWDLHYSCWTHLISLVSVFHYWVKNIIEKSIIRSSSSKSHKMAEHKSLLSNGKTESASSVSSQSIFTRTVSLIASFDILFVHCLCLSNIDHISCLFWVWYYVVCVQMLWSSFLYFHFDLVVILPF